MNKPRIVSIDIETSPIKGFTWEMYDARVLKVIEPSKVISVSWKWLGEEAKVKAICDYKGYKPGIIDDKALIEEVWHILDEADIVCAHNGQSFDCKKLNARFITYNLGLPSHYEIIDTLKAARKHFKFDQNSLDGLGDYLGEGRKISTGGFELWDECIKGDKKAWARMKEYNLHDTILLEKIYIRLRAYIEHPNLNLIGDTISSCPVCLSTNILKRGFSITKAGKRQRWQCGDCGSWSSSEAKTVKGVLR